MRILYALFSLCLLSACGAAPHVAKTSGDGPAKAIKPLPKPGQFYTPGLTVFGSKEGLQSNAMERRLAQSLRRTLTPSPTVDCLAREYAARFGADGQDPPPSVTYALAQHCGYWTRPSSQYSVTGKTIEEIETHLRALPDQVTQGAFGLGAAPHLDGRLTVTLLIPPQDIRLQEVPRAGPVTMTGRLQQGDGKIEFWVQDSPSGSARQLDAQMDTTGGFSLELVGAVGGHRIEVTRVRGGFRHTIALLRRGTERPTHYAPPKPSPLQRTDHNLAKSFNAQRSFSGLPALTLEQHLTSPLNDWMRRISKNTGADTPPGMLDPRGWRYARLDYGFTHGSTPEEAIHLLEDTPTGHKLLHSKDHDRLAVGLLPFRRGAGFDAVVVALSRFEVTQPDDAREQLLTTINSARRSAGLPDLRLSPDLTDVAQEASEAVMSGRLAWKNAIAALGSTIAERKLASGIFGSGGATVIELTELSFGTEPAIMTPEIAWVGVGVVGGPLPGGGSPRYVVIFAAAENTPNET